MSPAPKTPRQLSKILVPTDFSPSSDAAVDYATFLAERFGASVDVLYVWNARAESVRGARAIFSGDSVSGRAMAACVRDGARAGVKLRGRFEFGELSPTIGSVAESGAFDLIVMGLHENGRLAHFFGGDVAREVARIATCPVITVRGDLAGPMPREAPFAPWTELAVGYGPTKEVARCRSRMKKPTGTRARPTAYQALPMRSSSEPGWTRTT